MKEHYLGVYPMYQTENIISVHQERVTELEITCCHTDKISTGDIYVHKYKDNRFKVAEVKEERPAKGNHKQPATFYRLLLKI